MANRRGKLGFKITVDSDCSHEIKRCLLLGRKAVTNLDSILKSRDMTLWTKIHLVSYDFSNSYVQMSELDHRLIGKDSNAGKDWRQKYKREAEDEWLDIIIDSMDTDLSKLWEIVEDRGSWHATVHGVSKNRTWLHDWTTIRRTSAHYSWTELVPCSVLPQWGQKIQCLCVYQKAQSQILNGQIPSLSTRLSNGT